MPEITHAAWGQLIALVGTVDKFVIALRWNAYDDGGVTFADSYYITFSIGSTGSSPHLQTVSTTGLTIWHTAPVTPLAGDTVLIKSYNGLTELDSTTLDITPSSVAGPTSVSAQKGVNVFAHFTLGPVRPTDWSWAIIGGPGLTISPHTDTSDGGTVAGVADEEGIFEVTISLSNISDDIAVFTQQFGFTLHVSGERYIEDFHTDKTRTAVNIRHTKGTVESWNFNEQNELPLYLGDSLTLHAILRNGTGYLDTGVTNLKLVAKLPSRPDSPTVLKAEAPTPTVDTFGAVKAWPLTVTVDSSFARRIFDAANAPAGEAPASLSQPLEAQISYTHGGKTWRSNTFAIRLKQPISL